MKINIHAGHCPDGKGACGAVGLIKESTEARKVKDLVVKYLNDQNHTVYDCTCDTKETQQGCLTKIVQACNKHKVDIDISIHFNSGANDKKGNGKTTGTEVYIQNINSKAVPFAKAVAASLSELGFKNRGVKIRDNLYVLNKTFSPAMLIEVCFVDDKDDVSIYNAKEVAKAIVYGITGKKVSEFVSYVVKVNTKELNVRKEASSTSAKVTTVKQNEKYTIVAEKTNGTTKWGKLKSGIGWISLTYCKKV